MPCITHQFTRQNLREGHANQPEATLQRLAVEYLLEQTVAPCFRLEIKWIHVELISVHLLSIGAIIVRKVN